MPQPVPKYEFVSVNDFRDAVFDVLSERMTKQYKKAHHETAFGTPARVIAKAVYDELDALHLALARIHTRTRVIVNPKRFKGASMDKPKPKQKRGFAVMDPERRKEIAAKGGSSVLAHNRSFAKDRELAASAGAKGGSASRGGGRPRNSDDW